MTRWWKAARLRRRLNRPTPELQLIVRRLRAHLESAPGAALALVEIESAEAAAVALATLAHALVSEGQRVVLADAADGRPLATLLGGGDATGSIRMVSLKGEPVGLFVAPADPTRMADQNAGEDADVVLVLATVDPAFGADHLAAWADDAVVMVRAGEATTPHIDGVARQLRAARIIIRSGVLIGTDPDDHSSGVSATRPYSPDPADLLLETIKASGN
jgi:hypothetical protein